MYREVDDVIEEQRDVRYEDMGKLTYMTQVFKETARLYPPAPATARDVTQDTVIGGVRIPAGSLCVVS